jgi:hypothetical protein
MHELSVPKEAKQEDETEGCDECDEEFFPVHNFFLLRFLASPIKPWTFIAKADSAVDLKILLQERVATGLWPVRAKEGFLVTAHRAVATVPDRII